MAILYGSLPSDLLIEAHEIKSSLARQSPFKAQLDKELSNRLTKNHLAQFLTKRTGVSPRRALSMMDSKEVFSESFMVKYLSQFSPKELIEIAIDSKDQSRFTEGNQAYSSFLGDLADKAMAIHAIQSGLVRNPSPELVALNVN